jgi:hypothetical protein
VAAVSERIVEIDRAPLDGGLAVDGLRRAAKEIERAARAEGIEEGAPLGIFVAAHTKALLQMAALLEEMDRGFAAHVEKVHEAIGAVGRIGETDLEKVREMRKVVEATMEQARVAIREKDANYNKAFERQVQNIASRMIGEFEKWRVIKEGAWNRKMKWKWAAAASLLTLIVAGAGYGFREWEDRGIMQAVARCRAAPDLVVPTTGEGGCFVRKLVARDTADAAKNLQRAVMGLWPFGS